MGDQEEWIVLARDVASNYIMDASFEVPDYVANSEEMIQQGFLLHAPTSTVRMAVRVTALNTPPGGKFMAKWGQEQAVVVGDYFIFTKSLDSDLVRITEVYRIKASSFHQIYEMLE